MKKAEQFSFSPDLTRLFAAAVVSPDFCETLLQDAATALMNGYQGQQFALSAAEESLVLSIQAHTLADFASQVVDGRPVAADRANDARPVSQATGHSHDSGAALVAFPGF